MKLAPPPGRLARLWWHVRWHWDDFMDWLKAKPWRYRTACILVIPTTLPVCTIVGLVAGFLGGLQTTFHGLRSIVAGRPT